MDKILLEYEHCHRNKIEKRVTITSMVFADSNETKVFGGNISLAFDCDQKENCGVLTVLAKVRSLHWAECRHPKLSEVQQPLENQPS